MSKDQVINDPIHGYIRLHPLLLRIIDTPQFQRLRDIKQLGLIYWIFPGASHNRFEHSIGTSYLCGEMIEKLRDLHSSSKDKGIIKIDIEEVECLCIKIAGLCRNLGHGPFSNFFDRVYIPRVQGNPAERRWKHEQASCDLFDFMLEDEVNPGLNDEFKNHGLEEEEKKFIKALILGDKRKYKQGDRKSFFFEIVNNNQTGIDCGKFDYFARDCHNVGVRSNFDFQRYFHNIRIVKHGEHDLRIAVDEKEVFNLYELFHTRWSLHHRVYRHKTEAPIEDMLAEALLKVDEELEISVSIEDMSRFTNLTDNIIYDILRRNPDDCSENLKEARDILKKIQRRQLYKFCGYIPEFPPELKYPRKEDIAQEIAAKSQARDPNLHRNIFISVVHIHFGKHHKNPIDSVLFFDKSGEIIPKIERDEVSHMLPQKFEESYLRVYAKSPSNKEEVDEIRRCFKVWSKENNFRVRMRDDPYRSFAESSSNYHG